MVWLISAVATAVFAAEAALVSLAFAAYGNFGFEIFNLGIQIYLIRYFIIIIMAVRNYCNISNEIKPLIIGEVLKTKLD